MEAIKMNITVESDTITVTIPELSNYKGKNAELILIVDNAERPSSESLSKLRALIGKVDIDSEAIERLRETSVL